MFNTYSGVDIDLVLRVDENQRKGPEKAAGLAEKPPIKKPVAAQPRNKSGLNEKYIFKHFVVGKSNEFCYASSLASANKIGEVYNPLFLYGGVGLGKTHLLQAIGNHVLQSNPGAVVLYLTSEKFVNMLINALQHGTMANFRRKFRNLDVLLVDDIQFIGGKERTQEEFFHTFNTLYELKKQIVIASDKFPKEMRNLEERLRSRFAWGLIADIQPPELEIKIAILILLAQQNGFVLKEKVADYLANKINSNIRELEGALARVMAFASLTGRTIDTDLVEETLRGIYDDVACKMDIKTIQKTVCGFYGVKFSELISKRRSKSIAVPRHIAAYLCREFTDASLPEIGKSFGGRDHTTIMHAVSKIKNEVEVNTKVYNEIHEIKKIMKM